MKHLIALLLTATLAVGASLDNFRNFSYATLSEGIDDTATTLSVVSTNRLPAPPFNAALWNNSDYSVMTDPNTEIVRVTDITGTTLTITRAQEDTIAASHNTSGKVYMLGATATAKTFNIDIPAMIATKQDALTTVSQLDAEAGTSTTEHLWTPQRVSQAISALTPAGAGGDFMADGSVPATGDFDLAGNVLTNAGAVWIGDTNVANVLSGLQENKQPTNSILSYISALNTPGTLITFDASGDPVTAGPGTAGHVLTSNGAGVAPTYQAAATGDVTTTGTPAQYELPMYLDTTGDSIGPSGITSDGAGAITIDDLDVTTLTVGTVNLETLNIGSGVVTNNIQALVDAPADVTVIDMDFAYRSETLSGALTFLHATNGVAGLTQVLDLRAGGADRALTIPATWQTNTFSPTPANITNGYLTTIYLRAIGPTDSSANQTNIVVSYDYFKVP